MNCIYDITKNDFQILVTTISNQLYNNIDPYTIVAQVSTSLNLPDIDTTNAPNWCLFDCISNCIFNNVNFNLDGYNYPDIPTTLSCINSCYVSTEPSIAAAETDGAGTLDKEIEALKNQKDSQVSNILKLLKNTLDWYIDIIDRDLKSLAITVASFGLFIAMRATHEAIMVITRAGKIVGEAIEKLVQVYKVYTESIEVEDSALIASVTDTGVKNAHFHDILASATANAKEAITNFLGELGEHISGMGSDAESISDIVGTGADIVFDNARIAFDFASLGAQIKEHISVIDWTKDRMVQAEQAAKNSIDNVKSKYDGMISAREDMIKFKNEFDNLTEKIA